MLRPITSDDIEALAIGAWILGTGGGGSPYLGLLNMRKLYREGIRVSLMETYLGRKFRAVMSVEIGGGNALQSHMAAARLDLPVVDADAMGRAFPEAQMTSFAIHDLPMYPLTLADARDNAVIVARAASWKWMER